jgi:hypothetical protein
MVGNIFYRLAKARRVFLDTFLYSGTPFHVSPAAGGGERDFARKTGKIGIFQNVVGKWSGIFPSHSLNSGNVALSA